MPARSGVGYLSGTSVADGTRYDPEDIEFIKAMDEYKRLRRRPFPTWFEVLQVARSLGYRKVAEPTDMPRAPGS